MVHPKILEFAADRLREEQKRGLLIDYFVYNVGDDMSLLMTHTKGENNPDIHGLAWSIFKEVRRTSQRRLSFMELVRTYLRTHSAGTLGA